MALSKRWAAFLFLVLSVSCGRAPGSPSFSPNSSSDLPPYKTEPVAAGCDDVLGTCVARSSSYYVENQRLYYNGTEVVLKGLNWFGLEGATPRLHGLWTGRTIESFVDQVKELGFNALRVPMAPEVLRGTLSGYDGYDSPMEQFEKLVAYAESQGVYILMDIHTCSVNNDHMNKPGPGFGSCSSYSERQWVSDIQALADFSRSYPNVVGIDLFNEPFGFSWDQWSTLADWAGSAALRVNPKLLIFVEGVANASSPGASGHATFWGENLVEAGEKPLRLVPKSRLVYSPHAYGPSVANQSYFDAPGFPSNMPSIWDEHFGYLHADYPLVVGEFGGRYTGKDKVWNDAFTDYLKAKGVRSFFFWSLNPNSGDTGGLLKDDWQTVETEKYEMIKKLMSVN